MNWLGNAFGYGLLDPELQKRLTADQQKQLQQAALMNAGIAMLANSGPSPYPTSLGQVLASGFQAGRGAYGQQASLYQKQMQEQDMARSREMFRANLPEDMRQLYDVLGPDQFTKTQGSIAVENAKAKNKAPTLTTLQREAKQLFPGDEQRQSAWIMEQRSKPTGTTVNVSSGQAPEDPLSRIVTPQQRDLLGRMGVKLRDGIEYAWDKNNVPQPIKGTEPSKVEQDRAAKAPQAKNAEMLMSNLENMLDNGLDTGPIAGSQAMGVPLGKALDYNRKDLFERQVNQLSTQIRALFRIPGEGTLSDFEQKQYGLTLPSLQADELTNRQVMQNLRFMIRNAQGGKDMSDDDLINKYLN